MGRLDQCGSGLPHTVSPDVWLGEHTPASGPPCPVAGRSLRPSWASLARICLRCAIHGFAGQIRRLPGNGEPEASSTGNGGGSGLPRPSSGLWERAQAWMPKAKRTRREPRPGGPRRTSSERVWAVASRRVLSRPNVRRRDVGGRSRWACVEGTDGSLTYSTGREGSGGLAAAVAARLPTSRSQIASK